MRRSHRILLCCGLLVSIAGCSQPAQADSPDSPPAAETVPGDSAIRFEPDETLVRQHNAAAAKMGMFQYEAAHDGLASLVDDHPSWQVAKVNLGIATLNRQMSGDVETADALFTSVLEVQPENLRARYCRGLIAFNSGDIAAAEAFFAEVSRLDPEDAYAKYYLGQCRLSQGDPAGALGLFEEAMELAPYLRSAYYGGFSAARQLKDAERAAELLEAFQKLDGNPQARSVEIKYTRMGPKAEVQLIALDVKTWTPTGPSFAPPQTLDISSIDGLRWLETFGDISPTVTATDVNGDRRVDLFFTSVIEREPTDANPTASMGHLLLLGGDERTFEVAEEVPFLNVPGVRAALWGDYDNDGNVDVYLCREGPNQLWKQTSPLQWEEVTESTQTAGGNSTTFDGAMVDADHDGDLDIFVANDGPNELFINNLDGTFRAIAEQQGIAGNGVSKQVLFADLDRDRDADIIVRNQTTPHEVYWNDRLWKYREDQSTRQLQETPAEGMAIVDRNADGQVELITVGKETSVWEPSDTAWESRRTEPKSLGHLEVADIFGRGRNSLLGEDEQGVRELALPSDSDAPSERVPSSSGLAAWAAVALQAEEGPVIVGIRPGEPPQVWPAGPGRSAYVGVEFTGKESKGDQLRSNRSGVGVVGVGRRGSHWTAFQTYRSGSGPGQSWVPVSLGTGDAPHLDHISFTWPDGVFQTEMNLTAGRLHRVEETQRQLSSCPVVFAWNGEKFEFVTDILGVGGLGFNLGFGEYGMPRPWENLMLPLGSVQPRKGRFLFKICEPMEEVCYLDAVRLKAYHLPPGVRMVLDERHGSASPPPTGKAIYFREERLPLLAVNDRGEDVSDQLKDADGIACEPGPSDPRFLGLNRPHFVTLTFADPIADLAGASGEAPQLVFDGWIEYPYSQTAFAAWQAGLTHRAVTIEALDDSGNWKTVLKEFGYMAGMPRRSSVPLPLDRLPAGARSLRLKTNSEIYWDRLTLVTPCPVADVEVITSDLVEASVRVSGFARRTNGPQRRPHYDYENRVPLWDTRHPRGFYTDVGWMKPLVDEVDDAVAVIGPGEEVHVEFAAELPELPEAWTRRWVLEASGWCKDMDLFTRHGGTVGPLPRRREELEGPEERNQLHQQFNQRYRSW